MPVNLCAPNPSDLHPVPGVKLGITMAGVRKANRRDLTVITLQEWDDDAVHLSSHFGRVERDARLKHIVVSFGGSIVRVNPSVHLAGEGADGQLLGLYFADAGQHLEHRLIIDHDTPHCRSIRWTRSSTTPRSSRSSTSRS